LNRIHAGMKVHLCVMQANQYGTLHTRRCAQLESACQTAKFRT
jgi:hypothetical protein